MPDEPLTYTVTPGPAVLRKMGLSWTLFSPTGAHLATFSRGPGGETPGPIDLTLSKDLAADLTAAGYTVEPGGDAGPQVSARAEEMAGEPGEGVQIEPGTQADGSPAEPVKRRKS